MWILTITLLSTIGIQEPIQFVATKYDSLGSCTQAGQMTVNWLTQEFIQAVWVCKHK